jgi:urocanate hydratase
VGCEAHERIDDLGDAIERAEEAKRVGEPLSIGVLDNAAEVFPALLERSYVPAGYDLDAAAELR